MTKDSNSKLIVKLCSCGGFFKGPMFRGHLKGNPDHDFTVKRHVCLHHEVVATEHDLNSGQFGKDHGGCPTVNILSKKATRFLRLKLLCEEEGSMPPTPPEAPTATPVVDRPFEVPNPEAQRELAAALATIPPTSSDASSDGVDLDRTRDVARDLELTSDEDSLAIVSDPQATITPSAVQKEAAATREQAVEVPRQPQAEAAAPVTGIRAQNQAREGEVGAQHVSLQEAHGSLLDRYNSLRADRARLLEELNVERSRASRLNTLQKEHIEVQNLVVQLRKEKGDLERKLAKAEECSRASGRLAREAGEAAEADRIALAQNKRETEKLRAAFAPVDSVLAIPCIDGVLQPREMEFVTMDKTHWCRHADKPKLECHHLHLKTFGTVECRPPKVRHVYVHNPKRPPTPLQGPPTQHARTQ